MKIYHPGVSKGCCLEVFKYIRASKKHSFVTPGCFFFDWGSSCLLCLVFTGFSFFKAPLARMFEHSETWFWRSAKEH